MVFEMPEEISGQKNRNVLCQGRVIRYQAGRDAEAADAKEPAKDKEKAEAIQPAGNKEGLLAASIVDYKFIR
jgi:hypothetical protein